MTAYFISRHAGAIEWAKQQGIDIDKQIEHLDLSILKAGDCIYGTLPINLVATINAMQVRYFHLSLNLPSHARGKELSVKEMQAYGATLSEYTARKID